MHEKAVAGALAALILAACAQAPAPLPPELQTCAAYARAPNALQFCVVKQAANLPSPLDVARVCPLAGPLEQECRRAWAQSRANRQYGFSTEALLEVCAGDADCSFELLDARPEHDVGRQLELCASAAGTFSEDCAVHALERWVTARPDASEAARVGALQTSFPNQVGYALGMNRACYAGPECPTTEVVRATCLATTAQVQRAELPCPRVVAPPGFPRGRQ